jgi:hypothetical protein
MKQRIFTLIMMLALVIVAGKAFAQNGQNPIAGQKYTYTLGGLAVAVEGTAEIAFTGTTGGEVVDNENLDGSFPTYTLPVGTASFKFDVLYDAAETAGDKNIRVTITNGGGGCTNFIDLKVTVIIPTIALQITNATDITCQALKDPTTDNTAASIGAAPNTMVFTITPTTVPASLTGYKYNFNIDLDDWTFGLTDLTTSVTTSNGTIAAGTSGFDITGTATGVTTVTVTFATTTGTAEQDFTATIASPVLIIGTKTYTIGCSITDPDAGANVSTITYTPSIGTFTWNP